MLTLTLSGAPTTSAKGKLNGKITLQKSSALTAISQFALNVKSLGMKAGVVTIRMKALLCVSN